MTRCYFTTPDFLLLLRKDEIFSKQNWSAIQVNRVVGFIKQFTPYAWNLRSAPILFQQIYSSLASCICAMRSTFCIVSLIFGALYALRPAPNFYEIHPWRQVKKRRAEYWCISGVFRIIIVRVTSNTILINLIGFETRLVKTSLKIEPRGLEKKPLQRQY
jgi:hypothetical protein